MCAGDAVKLGEDLSPWEGIERDEPVLSCYKSWVVTSVPNEEALPGFTQQIRGSQIFVTERKS